MWQHCQCRHLWRRRHHDRLRGQPHRVCQQGLLRRRLLRGLLLVQHLPGKLLPAEAVQPHGCLELHVYLSHGVDDVALRHGALGVRLKSLDELSLVVGGLRAGGRVDDGLRLGLLALGLRGHRGDLRGEGHERLGSGSLHGLLVRHAGLAIELLPVEAGQLDGRLELVVADVDDGVDHIVLRQRAADVPLQEDDELRLVVEGGARHLLRGRCGRGLGVRRHGPGRCALRAAAAARGGETAARP
mmetsp:Transcript_107708/g.336894  ORF Transcript_107708/g.336894 Transcript_107708/m.336894 type:complete len:243 (-) Transcript_107708:15-743(-)